MSFRLIEADCIEAMQAMDESSVDAIVTDPPYGLEFMGKEWDALSAKGRGAKVRERRAAEMTPKGQGHTGSKGPYLAAGVDWQGVNQSQMQDWHHAWATEALRVLKPGGHLLAFGGTRTYHRLTCAIEDAGFEIRDCIAWMYGSGFPKSLDVSKAIDRAAGAEREVVGAGRWHAEGRTRSWGDGEKYGAPGTDVEGDGKVETAPATDDARTWQGWGTALKPAWESIIVATKPQVMSDLAARIGSCLLELSARVADERSTSSPSASAEASGSARSSAAARSNTSGGSSDLTATAPSGSATPTPSSIASSWKACWDDLCELTSMFTTGTTSSTTTALTTLLSCLEQITPAHITVDPSGEWSSLARTVDSLLAVLRASSRDTLMLSAIVSATEPVPGSSLAVGEPAPNLEPIVLARKPLSERNVAANVLRWGTGALNVDGCRIEGTPEPTRFDPSKHGHEGWRMNATGAETAANASPAGRWPANVTLDPEAAAMLDEQTGETTSGAAGRKGSSGFVNGYNGDYHVPYGDTGGASRFFAQFSHEEETSGTTMDDGEPGTAHAGDASDDSGDHRQGPAALPVGDENGPGDALRTMAGGTGLTRFRYVPKADREERNRGLEGFAEVSAAASMNRRCLNCGHSQLSASPCACPDPRWVTPEATRNNHPTVKPVELMRWLCRMVTPKGGTVLDPFTGSGTTGIAALREGFEFIGIEREAEYVEIARARIFGDAPLFNVEDEG